MKGTILTKIVLLIIFYISCDLIETRTRLVTECPKNENETAQASKNLKCEKDEFNNSQYLCLPHVNKTSLVEFCFNGSLGIREKGNCLETDEGKIILHSCSSFSYGCPDGHFFDYEFYKYPACQNISTEFHCYLSDPICSTQTTTREENDDISISLGVATSIVFILVLGIWIIIVKKKFWATKEQRKINREKIQRDEKITVRHIRGIIVGCERAGKTTLMERLKGTSYQKLKNIKSTVIADVHSNCFEVLEEEETIKYVDLKKPAITLHGGMLREKIRNRTGTLSESESDSDDCEEHTSDIKKGENEQIKKKNPYKTEKEKLLSVSDNKSPKERDIPKTKPKSNRRDVEAYKDENFSELLNDITKELNNELSDKKRLPPRVTFLDFAGQRMYYAFHQIYLSPKTFYILVVDMTKKLDGNVDEVFSNEFRSHEKDENGCSRFESWKYKDYYKYWLESINRFSDRKAPVIVVGTHAEELTKSDCVDFFKDWYALFKHHRHLKHHLHTKRMYAIRFPKDGSKLDELKEIKRCIAKIAQLPALSEYKIRYSWAVSERFLRKEIQSKKIITKQELINYNSHFKDYSMKANEIPELLKILYIAGTLLYFDEDDLKETIILDLQWFVNAFKRIIEYTVPEEETGDQKCQDFWSTGEISDSELEAIWNKYPVEGFLDFKTEILCYMERLELLAIFNAENSEDSTWYYVPSMNPREFDMNGEEFMKSSILCFDFWKKKQLPILIFYSVILKCSKLDGWTIHKREEDRKCIYKNVACFSFQGHIVVICVCRLQIQVQVWITNGHIDTTLLPGIQKSVEEIMEKFHKYSYEVGYKCQNGILNDEADKSFVKITEFPGTKDCTRCLSKSKPHSIDNKICWVQIKDSQKKVLSTVHLPLYNNEVSSTGPVPYYDNEGNASRLNDTVSPNTPVSGNGSRLNDTVSPNTPFSGNRSRLNESVSQNTPFSDNSEQKRAIHSCNEFGTLFKDDTIACYEAEEKQKGMKVSIRFMEDKADKKEDKPDKKDDTIACYEAEEKQKGMKVSIRFMEDKADKKEDKPDKKELPEMLNENAVSDMFRLKRDAKLATFKLLYEEDEEQDNDPPRQIGMRLLGDGHSAEPSGNDVS